MSWEMPKDRDLHIIEECSCGATIDVTGSKYRHDRNPANQRGAEEIVERWRKTHYHDPIEGYLSTISDTLPKGENYG